MSSRRKKKRNWQLHESGQHGLIPGQDPNLDDDSQDDLDDDPSDRDESDDTLLKTPVRKDATSVTTGPIPPPLPKHDFPPLPKHDIPQQRHELAGPHITFPPNAKRKPLESKDETKENEGSDMTTSKKKRSFFGFWTKREKRASGRSRKDQSSRDVLKTSSKKFLDQIDTKVKDPFAKPVKRRRRSRFVLMMLVPAVLIWSLPWIVTKTPLLNIVIAMATKKLEGTVHVQEVSCGWFSGISVTGLDVKDRQGSTIAEVPSIRGDRTLLGLAWNYSNLGRFKIEKPVVHVVFGPDGSTNVQELIAPYLEGESSDKKFDLAIEVTDAKVTLAADSTVTPTDPATTPSDPATTPANPATLQPLVTLSGVDASVEMLADPKAVVSTSVKVSGSIDEEVQNGPAPSATNDIMPPTPGVSGSSTSGQFQAELALGRENRLLFDANQVVLDRFSPLLAKIASGLNLQGSMTAQLDCRWGEVTLPKNQDAKSGVDASPADLKIHQDLEGNEDLVVSASATLDGFSATGGPLGTDCIRLEQPRLDCRLSGKDGVYILRQANLDSELATLNLDGQVVIDASIFGGESDAVANNAGTNPVAGKNAASKKTIGKNVASQTFTLAGRVNLVQLARMLPSTLSLHDQMEIHSGELLLNASSAKGKEFPPLASGDSPMVWNAELQATKITAVRRGQPLAWEQPVKISLRAYEVDQVQAVIERLDCVSSFLNFEAEGHREQFSAAARFDLGRLMSQLGVFIDLKGLQTYGRGWMDLNWQRFDDPNATPASGGKPGMKENFAFGGTCHLSDLVIDASKVSSNPLLKTPWSEPMLTVDFSTVGRMPDEGPVSLDRGEVQVTTNTNTNNEKIILRLTGPVAGVSTATAWPISIFAQGPLARWIERLHTMGVATDWYAQGNYVVDGTGSYQTDSIKFDTLKARIQPLQVTGKDFRFNEPNVDLTMTGSYDLPKSRLTVSRAKCQTSAAIVNANEVVVAMPDAGPLELAGKVDIRGDLAKMQAWIADPRLPATWMYLGTLTGNADLKQVSGVISGQAEANVQHLQLNSRTGHRFYEPSLTVTAVGQYDNATRVINLDDVKLNASALTGQAKGKINSGDTPMKTDLVGTTECDMQRLSTLLLPYIGPGIAIRGTSRNALKVAGPLTLEEVNAQAGIGWDSIEAYGFKLDKGKMDFMLDKGLLGCTPIHAKVNEGQVHLAPKLRVAPGNMQLEAEPGMIVERVRINQQMCEGGLKYIAPVLADITTVDGKFSMALDHCRIPIDNPKSGELAGRFFVHAIDIGPGPLVQTLAPVLKSATTAKLQKESVVRFQMKNGLVYHEGLELVFPEITIKTHGYVGLDQSLNIVAEMPIPQKWIDQTGGSIKPALRNQIVTLPIAGTLSRPKLNQQAMQKVMQQIIGNAAINVLDQQLNRLFQPK